jgi:hypothetical protein
MSAQKARDTIRQDRPKSRQTEAEHEWNNEGGQQPLTGGPLAPSRQPESEVRLEAFTLTLNRVEVNQRVDEMMGAG